MTKHLPYRKSKLSAAILMASLASLTATSAQAAPSQDACSDVVGNVEINDDQSSRVCTLSSQQSITITNTGLLDSVEGDTISGGSITNNGIIESTLNNNDDTGINIETSTMQGNIVNGSDGQIIANYGIAIEDTTINGEVINDGSISAVGGIGVFSNSTVTGKILNSGTMVVENNSGIYVESSVIGDNNEGDGVINSGTIETAQNKGIFIGDSEINGQVVNSGELLNDNTSGSDFNKGILIGGSTISDSVVNSGGIDNYTQGIILIESLVSNDVHNTADGNINTNTSDFEDVTAGIFISSSEVEGNVINDGAITTADKGIGIGIGISNSEVASVTNNGEITVNGAENSIVNDKGIGGIGGITIINSIVGNSNEGGVTNNNIITSKTDGILIIDSTINGDVINTADGSINAYYGIVIRDNTSITGSIINNGVIEVVGDGLKLDGDDDIVSVTGDLTNSGRIDSEEEEAINFDDLSIGGNFTNTATGSINADDDDAVEFDDVVLTGNFVNSGTIDGETGIDFDESSIGGSFTNTSTGTINGDEFGFEANSFTLTGSFTNDGSITSTLEDSYGVYIDSDSTLSTFTNNGTIEGANGVNIEGELNSFTNTGTIAGSEGEALRFQYLSDAMTINNSGTINGDVYLENHVLNISGGEINGDVTGGEGSIVNFTGDFTTGGDFWADSTNINEGVTLTLAHELNEAFQAGTVTNNGTIYVRDGETGTINDSYIQSSTGQFKLDLSSASSYGTLEVRDAATLAANAKIDVNVIGAPSLANNSTIEDIITADTITSDGTFEVSDNSAIFNFEGQLDGATVDLIVKQARKVKDISSSPAAVNGGVAEVIDGFIAGGTTNQGLQEFVTALGEIESNEEVAEAVDQVLPLLTGNQKIAQLGAIGEIGRVIQARTEGHQGMSSSADSEKQLGDDQYVWVKAFGSIADQDDYRSVGGFDADTKGMAIGVDGLITDKDRIGVSLVYSQTDVDSNDKLNTAEVDTYSLIGYGSHAIDDHTQVSYQAGYGVHKSEGKRSIPLMSTMASSDTDSQSINAAVSLLRSTPINDHTTFTPSLFSQYTWIDNDSYSETGAGALNLNVEGSNSQQWLFGMSGKFSQQLNDTFSLDMSAGLAYDLLNEDSQVVSAFAGQPGASFSTTGLERDKLEYRAGLGLNVASDSSLKLKLSYDYAGRAQFSNQSVAAKLRWSF